MSLRTADLGSVCVRARSSGLTQTPQQSHPLSPLHEPLHGELNAIRKQKCFLCSPFYGRACRWAMVGELKPKGPKGRSGEVFAYVGLPHILKDLMNAFSAVLSTEGRVAGLCWAN